MDWPSNYYLQLRMWYFSLWNLKVSTWVLNAYIYSLAYVFTAYNLQKQYLLKCKLALREILTHSSLCYIVEIVWPVTKEPLGLFAEIHQLWFLGTCGDSLAMQPFLEPSSFCPLSVSPRKVYSTRTCSKPCFLIPRVQVFGTHFAPT